MLLQGRVCVHRLLYAVPPKIRYTVDAIMPISFEDSVSICALLLYNFLCLGT